MNKYIESEIEELNKLRCYDPILTEAIISAYKIIFESTDANIIPLYRGLNKQFDPKYDLSTTDAPNGYSTWTDNPDLASQYAGKGGYVYKIDLPENELKSEYIDSDGERALFFNNQKKAGLNNVSGNEYLVYNHHDLFNISNVQLYKQA